MKATEQYFPVVLFIPLYKVVLTFESVDEILKCDHSNESYWAVLSCGAVYYAVQCASNFSVCGGNPQLWQFKWNLLSNTVLWCCLLHGGSKVLICEWNPYLKCVNVENGNTWTVRSFIMLWVKSLSVIIQLVAYDQFFPVVQIILRCFAK